MFLIHMKPSHAQWLKELPALFEIPAPDPARLLRRIVMMERNIMLPIKAVFIGMILYSFDFSQPWMGQISSTLEVTVETVQYIFWFYILANFILARIFVCCRTAAAGARSMDGGHEQIGGRNFYRGHGAVHGRTRQHFVLAVRHADYPQRGERAAGSSAIDFERRHQPVLRAGGGVLDVSIFPKISTIPRAARST